MQQYFKSLIDQDTTSIVLCDTDHIIRYMNPAAVSSYADRGGAALLGKNLMLCHKPASQKAIERVLAWFAEDKAHNRVHTMFLEKENMDLYMVALRSDAGELIGYYEQHIVRTPDTTPFYEI